MKRAVLLGIVLWFAAPAWAGGPYPFEPVGIWKVAHSNGAPFHITARADGSASSDWGEGEQGRWAFEGARLHFTWSDGWHDFIFRAGDHFAKVAYEPGAPLTGQPSNRTTADKVK